MYYLIYINYSKDNYFLLIYSWTVKLKRSFFSCNNFDEQIVLVSVSIQNHNLIFKPSHQLEHSTSGVGMNTLF